MSEKVLDIIEKSLVFDSLDAVLRDKRYCRDKLSVAVIPIDLSETVATVDRCEIKSVKRYYR